MREPVQSADHVLASTAQASDADRTTQARPDGPKRDRDRDAAAQRTGTAAIGTTTSGLPIVRAAARTWLGFAIVLLPVLLVSVDNTVLSFAMPAIAADLELGAASQLWIIDVYSLVLGTLLVTAGSLGDRFGRRRMLLIGATGFTVLSVVAAYATEGWMLIAARAGMGVFGSALLPSTLALIRNMFPHQGDRRLAIALWAATFSAGGALGPVVGGLLLDNFSWGAVFIMAVPVLVPLLALAPFLVPESRDPKPGRLDFASVAMSLVAMGLLTYAIKEVAVDGVTLPVIAMFAVAIGVGVLFVRRQLASETPLLDVRLFAQRAFTGAILVNMLGIFALIGLLFFTSQHLQLVLGLSATDAGLALLPGLAVMVVAGLLVVPITKRVPAGRVIVAGLVCSFLGYLAIALAGAAGALTVVVIGAAFGVLAAGVGSSETLSNDLILSSVPSAKAGAASAISETAYEFGAVLGTAVLGGILTSSYRAHLQVPAGVPAHEASVAHETLAGAVAAGERVGGDLGAQLIASAQHAFDSGVVVTASIGAALMIAAALLAHFLLGNRK